MTLKPPFFLSTLASGIDLWQPAWRPALELAVRHRLVSFGTHEPERQGGEADVKRFSPLMAKRRRAGGRARGKEGGREGEIGAGGSGDKRGTFFFFFSSEAGEQVSYFWFDGQNHFHALNLKISRPSLLFFLQEQTKPVIQVVQSQFESLCH